MNIVIKLAHHAKHHVSATWRDPEIGDLY